LVLPFWYLLTRVDPDIFQTSSKMVVCVCVYYYYYYNHFTAVWILSGTTRVSQHQKDKTRKVKPVSIYWSKR